MADQEILKYVTQIGGPRQSAGAIRRGARKLAAIEGLGYGPPVGPGTPKIQLLRPRPVIRFAGVRIAAARSDTGTGDDQEYAR
jgi:hypothetical protein